MGMFMDMLMLSLSLLSLLLSLLLLLSWAMTTAARQGMRSLEICILGGKMDVWVYDWSLVSDGGLVERLSK